MAVGSYAMGILVIRWGVSFWLALVPRDRRAIAAALLVGLPSLRLRADYFAITTLAFSEIVRYLADAGTGSPEGTSACSATRTRGPTRRRASTVGSSGSGSLRGSCSRCSSSTSSVFIVLTALVALLVRSPWGRVLNAIREDEDAAERWARTRLRTSSSPCRSRPRWRRSPATCWRSTSRSCRRRTSIRS